MYQFVLIHTVLYRKPVSWTALKNPYAPFKCITLEPDLLDSPCTLINTSCVLFQGFDFRIDFPHCMKRLVIFKSPVSRLDYAVNPKHTTVDETLGEIGYKNHTRFQQHTCLTCWKVVIFSLQSLY